jgi:hypothetical protein
MLKSSFAVLSLVLSAGAFAHQSAPILDDDAANAAMRYCQTVGIRAAWGAQARFLGAPAVFKYIPESPLKKMFMGDADIPNDGIYVLDAMDLEQRKLYEEVAFSGWKAADGWMNAGKERPDFEVLAALFYKNCKDSLTVGTAQQ